VTGTRVFLVAGLLALSGCASIPATHYYVLTLPAAPGDADPSPAGSLTIGVSPFSVEAPYDQEQIVYRLGGGPEVGFYAYQRWAVPLAQMLASVSAQALQGLPGVAQIEPRVSGRAYGAYLSGHLLALEEIDTPDGQTGYVRFALALHRPDGAPLWSGSFEGKTKTHTRDVRAVVEAMQAALGRALASAKGELAAAIANAHLAHE
jgi:uncharacterized lipoprotein YmbA